MSYGAEEKSNMKPAERGLNSKAASGLSGGQYRDILSQIESQDTHWRRERDKDEDYIHFRQRDSEAIAMLEKRGIKIHPVDNFIGKAVRDAVAVLAENKKDARVIANPNVPPELSDAVSEKLSVAEDETFCDRQCLNAGYKQAGVGLSWLEVHRNDNLLECPYKISEAPRNEVFWDDTVPLEEWYNGRWMHQRKFVHWETVAALWPNHRRSIKDILDNGTSFDWQPPDGGYHTGLLSSLDDDNFWTREEQMWMDREAGLINVGVTYVKDVSSGLILVSKTHGSLVFDKNNPYHLMIATEPGTQIIKAPVTKMTRTFFAGPLKLGWEEVKSGKFPYVPFYYFIDGRTGHPYGISRFMMSLQDEHNARTANDLWNLGTLRIKMTNGAVDMPIDDFLAGVSRPDFVAVLKREEMANGGIYEENREYELSQEQYKRNVDLRQALREAGGMEDAKQGTQGTGQNLDFVMPGKSLSLLMANHEYSRMAVIERLLDMILEDSLDEEEVVVPAKLMMEEKRIQINVPLSDGTMQNDVREFRGKIRLEDVPSSPERTRQEIISLSELAKSIQHEGIQNIIAPWVVALSGVPFKNELAQELRTAVEQPSEEKIQERIKEAVDTALLKAQIEAKNRELDIKEMKAGSEVEKLEAETALIEAKKTLEKVESIYSTMQAAMAIIQNSGIVPIGQQILDSSGFEDEDAEPVISQVPTVEGPVVETGPQNTSPMFPPRTQETPDTLPGATERITATEEADQGVADGIEKQGNQVGE